MKYGFHTAKRKVRQAKQTVNCIEATSNHSWESPEGVLYRLLSDGPHRNHKPSVKISFCLVLKALLLKYWETRLQYNSAQNSYQAQDLFFQYLNFCGSLHSTMILHLKAKTATAAQRLVYIQFHNEKNVVEEIYDWAQQQTSATPLPKPVCTQITMQPVQNRKMFTPSPLQLADEATASFSITARSSYSDKYWSTPKKLYL